MTTETSSQAHVEKKSSRSEIKVSYESSSESDEMETDGHSSDGDSEIVLDEGEERPPIEPEGDNSGGLANVMANILNKKIPSQSKTILAKALTSRQILNRKQKDMDIETKEVAIIEKKKLWENMCRVKPNPLDKDRERQLQKIATRGVVQLFNAVKKQQKTVEEKLTQAGSSSKRKEMALKSVTKGAFLDLLKGTNASVSSDPNSFKTTQKRKTDEPSEESKPKWSILREDFMMGATLKDWDRNSSDEETSMNNLNNKVEDSDSEVE